MRTPRARPPGMSRTVGLPAPMRERDMIEAHAPGLFQRDGAAEAHAAEHGEVARRSSSRRIIFRKFLSQRTVMPYSATPPKPAMARLPRSSEVSSTSRIGWKGTRLPSRDTGECRRQRLDLQPVDRHHGVAVVQQIMRQRVAGRSQAHHQHLRARGAV